jgi:hypothetical protein
MAWFSHGKQRNAGAVWIIEQTKRALDVLKSFPKIRHSMEQLSNTLGIEGVLPENLDKLKEQIVAQKHIFCTDAGIWFEERKLPTTAAGVQQVVIDFLRLKPRHFFSVEQIAAGTHIVSFLLSCFVSCAFRIFQSRES